MNAPLRFIAAAGALVLAAVAFAQALPADIVYENAVMGNTTFSHATHSPDKGMECADCHPAAFQMAKGATTITMAEMNAGNNCGTCHKPDGKAFPTTECASCHKR